MIHVQMNEIVEILGFTKTPSLSWLQSYIKINKEIGKGSMYYVCPLTTSIFVPIIHGCAITTFTCYFALEGTDLV